MSYASEHLEGFSKTMETPNKEGSSIIEAGNYRS